MSTEKKKVFAERLLKARDAVNISQSELAARVNVKPSSITQWENAKYFPQKREIIERLAQALSVSRAWLAGETDDPTPKGEAKAESNAKFTSLEVEGLRRVPVISWARAGQATDYEDMANQIEDWTLTQTRDENAFALIVEGNSMESEYLAGDLIVASPNSEPRNRDVVVARLRNALAPNTGGVLLKRFYRTGLNGSVVRLESANKDYEALEFKQEDFWFIYPVVTLVRKTR